MPIIWNIIRPWLVVLGVWNDDGEWIDGSAWQDESMWTKKHTGDTTDEV